MPQPAEDFVRRKMTPEFLRNEGPLHSIRSRIDALDRASQSQLSTTQRSFASFPTATIYAPVLYIPQAMAISMAKRLSNKVYIWFYAARTLNAIFAVAVIFLGLRAAPEHALLLMSPLFSP